MSTSQFNEFPRDAFRAILAVDTEQRELIKRYIECSDEVQFVVRSMFEVLEREDATNEEHKHALTTIAGALELTHKKGAEPQAEILVDRFADRLRKCLVEKNITQEALADRMDCTQSAISKLLSRHARPRRKTIFKLAKALSVAPTELWPQLDVAAILDSVADFFDDQELTQKQAVALESAGKRPPAKVKTRNLPSRKRV